MKIIVGLGNPGKEYEGTRHNVGFRIVDRLGDALEGRFKKSRLRREAVVSPHGVKTILVKPETFMNVSGGAVAEVLRYYHLGPETMLVVHDDLDLPLGRIKFSEDSSAAGHNGVASIIDTLDTQKFSRLRIGIGRPPQAEGDVVDYVLKPFLPGEKKLLEETVVLCVEAVRDYLKSGIETVMNRYNKK